jgi:hypothetical protein
MAAIGNGISHVGITQDLFNYPWKISGSPTQADVGKAVSIDTTAAYTVKLAADNDPIIGVLETLEIRTIEGINVCTVSTKGGWKMKLKTSETVTIGQEVQGGGAGEVKGLAAQNDTDGTGTPSIKGGSHQKRNIVVNNATSGFCDVLFL